jgi:hypothetical protein
MTVLDPVPARVGRAAFTLLVLPTFYLQVHGWLEPRSQ